MTAIMASRNISESARERETFRHDPTLLSDVIYNDTGEPVSTLEFSTTADPILTGLAQLGACRTGASRAFISLFDQAHQYIIAEATRTSPLRPDSGSNGTPRDPFWLQGTAIPRSKGVCQQFLNTMKQGENGCDAELPVTMIPDIRADPQISEECCLLLGSPTRGFVGVPIRSENGVDFGEYSVVTEQPIQAGEWSDADSRLLREISRCVLDHLLSKGSQIERKRAEKKTRGIRCFVERSLTSMASQHGPTHNQGDETAFMQGTTNNEYTDSRSTSPEFMRPNPQSHPVSDAPSEPLRSAELHGYPADSRRNRNGLYDANSHQTDVPLRRNSAPMEPDPLTVVFSRAANIIRESMDADGVVFFDASVGSFNSFSSHYGGSNASQFNSSEEESWDSDDTCAESSASHHDPHIIASSTLEPSKQDGESYHSDRRMSSRAIATLLRRYPRGTIFDFDENGKLQPSNSLRKSNQPAASATSRNHKLARTRTLSFVGNVSNEVFRCFPGARSVAFVPVWDQVKKRWRAGCFAYTLDKTRFFSTQGDISYLFAFATLAMAEIASLETHLDSQAQSDVLGSLSHELRSPLHGIILGVEFLSDTPLSVFQGNLLHILETCGRTLSDTIDHLLYYAKVNNFIPPGKTPDSRARGLRKEMNYTLQAGMKTITGPVRVDVLVEEVTESIFAGFNFQRLSIGQLERDHRKSHADTYAIRRSDNFQAIEDLGPWLEESGGSSFPSKHIVIDLAIDPKCSHYYHAISGAIRRIVMNLFGNALKFTSSGSIRVVLSQEVIHSKKSRASNLRWAKIVVIDTGKGIAEDFLINHLFQEFRQEDPITPGLGLGLSVVEKIVSSLKGRVSIESQLGVGTTATVLLPLQPICHPSNPTEVPGVELDDYTKQRRQLKGLRVCFVGFDKPLGLPNYRNHADDYPSIWNMCRKDLAMEVVTATQAINLAPDIVLCEEAALYDSFVARDVLSRTPLVVVCANALSAYRLSVDSRFEESSVITEFISQPTGPRKLAKILMAALQRWVERQDQSDLPEYLAPLSLRRVSSRSHDGHGKDMFNILNMTGSGFETPTTDRSRLRPRSPSLSPRSSPQPPSSRPVSPKKHTPEFLLVEDNVINMRILCAYMKKLGRSYATAQDGQIAVDKYRAEPGHYNCLLMDINMPRLDGLQATRQIRGYEAENHLERSTIITLSGLASATVQQEALESGVDLFLTKPVKLQEISQILKSRDLM
ncbi:hypothetical protein E0Z10_g2490 [Xylaria hypoxylon]|uniref:histidine kinase n=1 Tax=Xylaria hypoxylon TaxID=37992 RepID=A0A4Z0Z487_9PEZI|nr:hypothetical protein E0Z10_g2490 [Xylaria hypoxylon]